MKRNWIWIFLLLIPTWGFGQGASCSQATQVCSGNTYTFNPPTGQPNSQSYGCCNTTPNRSWFFFRVGTAGPITINMFSTPSIDIDYVCFGPFDSLVQACGSYSATNIVACGYGGTSIENCVISAPVVNKLYLLLITNFGNQPCTVNFSQTAGTGTMPCLAPPTASVSSPICAGQNINLQASGPANAVYHWTGPGAFSSNQQNPVIANATAANSGTYSVNYTLNGQTSPAVNVSVTVNPVPANFYAAGTTICSGFSYNIGASSQPGLTYQWASSPMGLNTTQANPSVTPLASTVYYVTATSAVGCSSVGIVNVNVNPLPLANTGPAQSICSGNSVTLGSPGLPGHTYSWTSVPASSIANQGNPTVTPLANTVYTLTETITATGCIKTNSVSITVLPNATAYTHPDTIICSGVTVNLGATAVAGTTYSWSSNPGTFSSTLSNPAVNPTQTTIYTLTATKTSNGCFATQSVTIAVNPLPPAQTGPANAICVNTSIQLGTTATAGHTYQWTSSPSGLSSNVANPTFTPTQTTTFTLLETITATGCTASNSVTITLVNPPAAITGPPVTICSNSSYTLGSAPVAGNTYNWSSNPGTFTSTLANPVINPTNSTTYTLTETNPTGCATTQSVVISVNPLPAANAGQDVSVCAGTPTTIGSAPVNGSTYSWSCSPGTFNSTISNPMVFPTTTTTYTLTETITATGCHKTNSVVVTVNPLPTTNIINSTNVCSGTTVTLGGAASPGNSYFWTAVPGGATYNISNPSVTPAVTTTYILTQTVTNTGCSKMGSVTITILPSPLALTGTTTNVCQGAPITLGAAPTGNNTYSWTSNPAGFTSNISNPIVTPSATTTYTLTETNPTTSCSKTNSVLITVVPAPNVTFSPLSTICEDASPFTLTGGTPLGGTYSGPGITGNLFYPSTLQPNVYTLLYTYKNASNCSSSATQTINLIHKPKITGSLRYDNDFNTLLDSSKIILKDANLICLDSVWIISGGYYTFKCLNSNHYQVTPKTYKSWGGGNATDALLVAMQSVGLITFSPIRTIAADVNHSSYINGGDSYLIMRRFLHMINSFPSGDWYFDCSGIMNIVNQDTIKNCIAICFGDVNGSYVPLTLPKGVENVSLNEAGQISLNKSVLKVPVRTQDSLTTNALSLVMEIPDGLEIVGIKSDLSNLMYYTEGKQLRIAWYDLNTLTLGPGEVLFNLLVKNKIHTSDYQPNAFRFTHESEFADPMANVIEKVGLTIPHLINDGAVQFDETEDWADNLQVFPNPARNEVSLKFELQKPGNIFLNVYSVFGQQLGRTIELTGKTGYNEYIMPLSDIEPGTYHLKMVVVAENSETRLVARKKLFVIK